MDSNPGPSTEPAAASAGEFDPFDYPRRWEADVLASDGGTVHLRPITPRDAEDLRRFHGGLSSRTRYFRYFGPYPQMSDKDLRRFSTMDHRGRVAFAAWLGDDIIAVGRYERLDAACAEIAFVVDDAHQRRGLGSVLLEHLAAAARESGFRRFVAGVLAENGGMLRVFRDAGYSISRAMEEGVLRLEFEIDPTERSVTVARAREQAAEARSVHNLLTPTSIAVIGASSEPGKVGYVVLSNLLAANFNGPVFPVNSAHVSVRGVRSYPCVLDIPDPVDLAVIAVPAERVEDVLDACLAKGVKALVVLSGGFSETGQAGHDRERTLVSQARAHGMRVVGPNALGVANTDPAVRLNATLAPHLPRTGRIGFFCQSGALGITILASAASRGIGLSSFVSAGNRADVSGNDLLQFFQTDPNTDVVLLYLESFGNPRKFARLARRLARHKPVVAVKSGRHAVSPALLRTSAVIDESSVAALFEQAGVIRVETIPQLFDTALLLSNQPLPAGDRVCIVGNSTAIGVLAADTVLAQGMRLACEPVGTGTQASPAEFAEVVSTALSRTDLDSLVVVFVPPIALPVGAYAAALRAAVSPTSAGIPIVSTFLAVEGVPDELAVLDEQGLPGFGSIPSYSSPERAVQALGRVTRYAQWRSNPLGELVRPEVDAERARTAVEEILADADERTPTDAETAALLRCYGIETEPFEPVRTAVQAVQAAQRLGYPVVLKLTDAPELDDTEVTGVRLGLFNADAVRAAHAALLQIADTSRFYVQRMAPSGTSCVLGVQEDPSFGSLIYFGLSGVVSDLVGDRAYRAVPLTDTDARWLVRAPRAAALLAGWRGRPPVDLAALEDLVLRLSTLAEDLPEVRSLVLEPVIASPSGAAITKAHLTLGRSLGRPDEGPRRLRS
ncbi:MAG: GNAT family N-acetyltransferase [Sciscionella sp.]